MYSLQNYVRNYAFHDTLRIFFLYRRMLRKFFPDIDKY